MNLFLRLEQWGEAHHPRWIDIVRIGLGIFLIYKGLDFLTHMSKLLGLMSGTQEFGMLAYTLAGHYVVFAHLLGGLALIIGMFVRASCILQIPILLGAVFFVNTNQELLQPYSEIVLSVVVLLLLVYFLLAGNGKIALKFPEERPKGT